MFEVEKVCDRVIFLKEGKIIAIDTPSRLAKTISDEATLEDFFISTVRRKEK